MTQLEEFRNYAFPQMLSKAAPYGRQIVRHIERTIGTTAMFFHDVLPNGTPLDIHVIPPQGAAKTSTHPFGGEFFTLVTSGLSTMPVGTRAKTRGEYLELMISLPATWPGFQRNGTLDAQMMDDERYAWPLHWLKRLASQPAGSPPLGQHSCVPPIENAPPLAPETKLRYLLLAASELHPKSRALMVHDDIQIHFQALWPLYLEEAAFIRRHGAKTLLSELHRENITDLVSPRRQPSLTPARHEA